MSDTEESKPPTHTASEAQARELLAGRNFPTRDERRAQDLAEVDEAEKIIAEKLKADRLGSNDHISAATKLQAARLVEVLHADRRTP